MIATSPFLPTTPSASPAFVQLHFDDQAAVRAELADGLLADKAVTSPKYLYDALGSRLFEAITELPEYYPTRTEAAIFAQFLPAMAAAVGTGHTLIDLGAGNCAKAAGLFSALQPAQYVAVDISVDFLKQALTSLQRQHPDLPMLGVGMDFSARLGLPAEVSPGSRVFFYPGSSIGNFTPADALPFLWQIHSACMGQGGLLIGVDLVKSTAVLQAAYDDVLGVTAAFNRNMLLHLNHLLGSNFNISQWQHRALFNTDLSRIEMHLDARQDLSVRWPDGGRVVERAFVKGEGIHTENSYKYTVDGFAGLLTQAGFQGIQHWQDAQSQFCVFWAKA
jgi:dimethylhistidine N-methyltransferase